MLESIRELPFHRPPQTQHALFESRYPQLTGRLKGDTIHYDPGGKG